MTFQKTLPVAGIAVLAASATAEQPLSMIRFASVQTRSTEEWKGTLKAFREHPGCCDDVWFSTGESFPSLDWHRKHLKTLAPAAEDLRRLGIGVSLQFEATIGHGDDFPTEAEKRIFDKPWTGWTCSDGTECRYCSCPRQPAFLERLRAVSAIYAAIRPAVVWIDDDLRTYNHYPSVRETGCWCARCIADFSGEEKRTWTRETLAAAVRDDEAVRSRWLDFSSRSCGEIAAVIARAFLKVSPETRMGFQCGYDVDRDHEDRVIIRALAAASGKKVSVRMGGGPYYDDWPHAQLLKSQWLCEARKRLALEDVTDNWCNEVETYPRAYGSRSARSIALESFSALAWGMDSVSLFVLDRRSETDAFYSDYLLGPLAEMNRFLHGYRAACRGTTPAGFECPMPETDPGRMRFLCGIPILHGPGVSWGVISTEKQAIGGLGTGWGEVRDDLLPDCQKTPSAKIQAVRDHFAASASAVLKSPFVGHVIPRVSAGGELRTVGLIGTRLDPQRNVCVWVRTDKRKAVWREFGEKPVELAVEGGSDGFASITIPALGAWNAGYLEF